MDRVCVEEGRRFPRWAEEENIPGVGEMIHLV